MTEGRTAYIYQDPRSDEEIERAEPKPYIPGVPTENLTVEQVEVLPLHLRRSVEASPLYRATVAAGEIRQADKQEIDRRQRAIDGEEEPEGKPKARTRKASPRADAELPPDETIIDQAGAPASTEEG